MQIGVYTDSASNPLVRNYSNRKELCSPITVECEVLRSTTGHER